MGKYGTLRVKGHCVACGREELTVSMVDGDIQCSAEGCPAPGAVARLLAFAQPAHTVQLVGDTYTIVHPRWEFIDKTFLLDCDLANYLGSWVTPARPNGEYRALRRPDGEWSFDLQPKGRRNGKATELLRAARISGGGYESSDEPSPRLPKVRGGPAPGAEADPDRGAST